MNNAINIGRINRERFLPLTLMLLLYSLIPGISKITDNRSLFVLNSIVILALILFNGKPKAPKIILPIVIFFLYVAILTLSLIVFGYADQNSAFTSFYMFLLPMLGVLIGTKLSVQQMALSSVVVASVHAVLGILFYNFFEIQGALGLIIERLKDGVFQFRMASVSGSIVFGATMLYGLIGAICMYECRKKLIYLFMVFLFLFCIILSQQRSAWGVSLLYLFWYCCSDFRRRWLMFFCIGATFLLISIGVELYDPGLAEYFKIRFLESFGDSNQTNILNERSHMWVEAIDRFIENPFGYGAGQAGWVAYTQDVNVNFAVTDGDYFRILLESGVGLLLLLYTIYKILFKAICSKKNDLQYVWWMSIGSAVQMIGSNITELYYANFIFWLAIGVGSRKVDG